MLTAVWPSWTCGRSHDVPLISLRISDLVRLAGWLFPSLSPHSFHTWRMLKIDLAWAFSSMVFLCPLTIRLKCAALAIFSSLLGLRFACLAGTGVGCVGIFGGFA